MADSSASTARWCACRGFTARTTTREPPAPIFAELMSHPYYEHVGDLYWKLDETGLEQKRNSKRQSNSMRAMLMFIRLTGSTWFIWVVLKKASLNSEGP